MSTDPTAWWRTAVVYQLYVRSFADSNGDGIGDLGGIVAHLDDLVELGIDALWLNPCYPSPQLDHGYDIADYFSIEPDYGTLEDFDRLVAGARSRGIRIMMDVVPNHCSWDHPWFRAAVAAGRGSPERERFYFRDGRGPDGSEPPNDWIAVFKGSAWTRVAEPDGSPGQWYLHVFSPPQPDWNWNHPDVAEHFDRMLTFWFDRGVEGFRADAVPVLGKTDGLPDVAGATLRLGVYDLNPHFHFVAHGHEAWRRWRRLVDAYERSHPGRELVTVAEAHTPGRPDLLRQYVNDLEFHQSFAFDLLLSTWNASALRDGISWNIDALADDGLLPAWTMNNHDVQRVVTRYGRADATLLEHATGLPTSSAPVDLELGLRRARAAVLLQLGLPGCIYLYAGEELGLPEVLDLPVAARQDPLFIRTEGAELGRDGCRVPLPWTTDPQTSFGFSPGPDPAPPWMPQPDTWGRWAADLQAADPTSMLALVRSATHLRRRLDDLLRAPLEWIEFGVTEVLAYRRGEMVVVVNTGPTPVDLPDHLTDGRRVALSSVPGHTTVEVVPPDAAVWLAP